MMDYGTRADAPTASQLQGTVKLSPDHFRMTTDQSRDSNALDTLATLFCSASALKILKMLTDKYLLCADTFDVQSFMPISL